MIRYKAAASVALLVSTFALPGVASAGETRVYRDVVGDGRNEPVVRFERWGEDGQPVFQSHQFTVYFEDNPDWVYNCGERIRNELIRRMRARIPRGRGAPDLTTERRLHEAAVMGEVDEIVIRQARRVLGPKFDARARHLANARRGDRSVKRLEIEFAITPSGPDFNEYCGTTYALRNVDEIFRGFVESLPPRPELEEEAAEKEADEADDAEVPREVPARQPEPQDDPRRYEIENAEQIDELTSMLNRRLQAPSRQCRPAPSGIAAI